MRRLSEETTRREAQRWITALALYAACDPLQKGLVSDLPHLHKVMRFRIS
jgi:hypothetical protein